MFEYLLNMSTTKGATAIALSGEVSESVQEFNGPPMHCRRKMKKLCCCLTFLLLLNFLLTMHIAHEICEIMHIFYDNDIVLMPGGQQSFCNDFCVDLCINDADNFKCDVISCLNNCNLHFGNEQIADIQPTPDNMEPSLFYNIYIYIHLSCFTRKFEHNQYLK